MLYASYISFIIVLPLAVFLLLGLFGKNYFRKWGGIIGTTGLLVCTLLAGYAAWQYFFGAGHTGVYQPVIAVKYNWLHFTPALSIDIGILLDPISVMMLLVVTFISLMVHLFSIGYMKGEERISTYYAFLSLFTFSMLGLVVSSNIFQIYIFWELVGVSSYLLIGFYFERPSAVAAAKKAFIVTRFADLGFLVGILMLSFYGETLDFHTLIARLTDGQSPQYIAMHGASFIGIPVLTWALALVFMGGAGKSAMFPLHVWLPDAMEGPTPVSALIHAATMVVAGVFLVARLFPVFYFDGQALQIVTWVGAFSAVFAAVIACTQTDIKRVLAYSTMSQIGYMMFALGVSRYGGDDAGYTASMFHLFTHAFFKSLLFLCAGAIIHAVHSNEIKDMGGLRKLMPLTHIAFLVACLAISGIPPFSGFFSKEEILSAARQSGSAIYTIALVTSGITAFYMFRLYFSIFWNKNNDQHHLHGEGTLTMKVPLAVLSVCALLSGFVPFSHFITADGKPAQSELQVSSAIIPVLLATAGILLAGLFYYRQNDKPQKLVNTLGSFYRAAVKKFYIDEVYRFVTKKIIFNLIARPAAWIDRHIIDGLMNGIASVTAGTSLLIKGVQSGRLQQYTLYFFAGVLGLGLLFLYLWR